MAEPIDENAARVILKKIGVAKYKKHKPQQLAKAINDAYESLVSAISKGPRQPSKVIKRLIAIKGDVSRLKQKLQNLDPHTLDALVSTENGFRRLRSSPDTKPPQRVRASLKAFLKVLENQLNRLEVLLRAAELNTGLPPAKGTETPGVSTARANFYARLLLQFGLIKSPGRTPYEFAPLRRSDGIFVHDPVITFVVEVVRRCPMERDRMLKRREQQKTTLTVSQSETDQLYQAVAQVVDRLIQRKTPSSKAQLSQ